MHSLDRTAGKSSAAGARWEHFAHQADIGVRGYGSSPARAFEQAALALTAVTTDPAGVGPLEAVEISCDAPTIDLLLFDWLNTLVFESATRHLVFSRFHVQIDGCRLTATAWGETLDRARHEPAVEVKGATMTALRVARDAAEDVWIAQCIVDV
jgi:SHS2 domain-containing protein